LTAQIRNIFFDQVQEFMLSWVVLASRCLRTARRTLGQLGELEDFRRSLIKIGKKQQKKTKNA